MRTLPHHGGSLTKEEMDLFRTHVRTLEKKGWTRTALALELGYSAAAPLSIIMNDESKGAGRDKYERLKEIIKARKSPPPSGHRVIGKEEYNEFVRKINTLRSEGLSMEEIGKKLGFSGDGSLRQAIKRGRVRKETWERLQHFAQNGTNGKNGENSVHAPKNNASVLEKLDNTTNYLEKARRELETAINSENVKWIVRPGLERAKRQIEDLITNLSVL